MPAAWTQMQLRQFFQQWGLPLAIRVDNGHPWGSASDLPTDLALWLIGLGIEMIWNPPRRPQDNGVIERSQGTGKRWAEPSRCGDTAELQRRIDQMDHVQRALFPYFGEQSRMEVFSGLSHSGRPYDPREEASWWERELVLWELAGYTLPRKVDSGGSIYLYNRGCYVAKALKGTMMYVTLDPHEVEWVVADKTGVCYRRLPAKELTATTIRELGVSGHRERPPRSRHTPAAEFTAQAEVA